MCKEENPFDDCRHRMADCRTECRPIGGFIVSGGCAAMVFIPVVHDGIPSVRQDVLQDEQKAHGENHRV